MVKRHGRKSMFYFMVPGLMVLLLFFGLPIVLTIFYSFSNLALTGSNAANFKLVGFDNYIKMFRDSAVIGATIKTLVFTICCVLGQNILGFMIAHLMQNKNTLFRRILGPIFLSAWVMPEVVGAICAYSVLTDKGTINAILAVFGIAKISWLYNYPMLSIIVANIWRGTAYSMMVYQAALDNVSGEVKESAKIDGATKWQTITKVIIPIIKQTILTNTMLTTLMTLGAFGFVWIITAGGPGSSTTTLPILMYMKAFKNYDLGYGTAISMILLAISAVFGVWYTRMAGEDN